MAQDAETIPDTYTPQIVAVLVLIGIYSVIPILAAAAIIFQIATPPAHLVELSFVVDAFHKLSGAGETPVSVLTKIILPLTVVLTGANFTRIKTSRFLSWLFVIPMIGLVASLLVSLLLSVSSSVAIHSQVPPMVTLGYEFAGNLATYLMLMVGIQISPERK